MTTLQGAAQAGADAAALCVVPLRASGRPPLYCVHEISGTVRSFTPLARRLAAARDVIGLQSLGLNPQYAADRTIEQMAGRYLQAIERRGHTGPYELIGYSMGGLIAFEMATRLARAGRRVRLLGLLDAPAPGSARGIDGAHVMRLIARRMEVGAVLTAPATDAEELLGLLVAEAKAARTLPPDFTADDLRPMADLMLANGRAVEAYRPSHVWQGDVHLIGAGKGALDAKTRGWAPYVAGRITGQEVPADHFSLLRGAAGGEVAGVIEGWLAGPCR